MVPSDVVENGFDPGRRVRIGGLVEAGSMTQEGTIIGFNVTDLTHTVTVSYNGILPDLFREGQGVVAEGSINKAGLFNATEVLAKHDENYMPREVADKLKDCTRESDTVARLSGDSFILIMPVTSSDDIVLIAEKVLKSINEPVFIDGHETVITSSI